MLYPKITLLATAVLLLLPTSVVAGDQEAVGTPDKAEQEQNARIRARIAAELGDFQMALSQIETAALLAGDRTTATKANEVAKDVESKVAGGASMADFTELINLIRTQTDGIWDDTDPDNGGSISISTNGVFFVGPKVIQSLITNRDSSNLQAMLKRYISANHNKNVRIRSQLRMVSIPKLDRIVANEIRAGRQLSEDVRNLAGLQRIDYLIVSPETGEIVIAGPAGDWKTGVQGNAVSVATGRPVLQLDDLVTLSRTFSRADYFMCTINPKQQHIAAVQEFVNKNRSNLSARSARAFAQKLEEELGLQDVLVQGVPQNSRVASVIVEADYRMKEIGIGKRKGVKGMKSYFDLLTRSEQRGSTSMDALRWWMAAGYDAVTCSQDKRVFQFDGDAIQCLSEDQRVVANGQRIATGKSSGSNARFAQLFTKHLPELADADPVFADLENVFDLSLVAALIHKQGLATRVGWQPKAFAINGNYAARKYEVPRELMTAANHKQYKGGHIVIQVAGGVRANLTELLNQEGFITTGRPLVTGDQTSSLGQQNDRWWWDASE